MAITSIDNYIAASKQKFRIVKTASRTSVATIPFSVFDLAGSPGAGALAGADASAGVKPVAGQAGYPPIATFGGGNTGYLTGATFRNGILSTIYLYDRLFVAGAYSYAAGTSNLSLQPAISDRCPDYPGSGTVFGVGNEIWIEVSTSFVTGTAWQVQVTYTNANGTAGQTSVITAAAAAAALTAGKCLQLPLQAGDSGVQKIESVIVTNGGTLMTAGAFNVMILRPLAVSRITVAGAADRLNIVDLGMPTVYQTSALYMIVAADSTATNIPEINLEISNG